MTTQELLLQHKAARRRETRRLWWLMGFVVLCFGGIFFGIEPLIQYIQSDAFRARLQEFRPSWLLMAGAIGCFLAAWVWASLSEREGVNCPACGERLLSLGVKVAGVTGHCCYCGEKIVEDSSWKPDRVGRDSAKGKSPPGA